MAQLTGARTSYDGGSYTVVPLTPQKRAIADLIDIIDPYDVPVLKYLGIGDMGAGGMSKVSQFRIQNWPNTRVEWLEDTLNVLTTTMGSSVVATNVTTSVNGTFTVAAANILRPGHVIKVDNERMLVRSVSSDSVTANRMWGGTATNWNTSASHAVAAVVEIISNARDEGDESDADYTTQVAAPYNYSQIFQAECKVTRTQNKISQFGISGEYDYEVQKRFKEQVRLLEKTVFHGARAVGTSQTAAGTLDARSMGGLDWFITDNTASLSSGPLTQKDLEDQIQACWTDGGNPDLIICNGWVKRKISSFYAPYVRTTRTEATGGVTIDQVDTEFGTLNILMSRWCPSAQLYIVSSEYIGILPYEEFFDEPLAKTGDYERGQIVGEYTLVVKNDKAHARLTSISTTS